MGWFWFRTLHTGATSHATSHRGDITASYLSHYLWDSLVAQMIKNLPTMRETWVRSLGWEDPLEEGMTTHSSILAWRIPMDRGLQPVGSKRAGHN